MTQIVEGYILGEVIGEGSFGSVYRAVHKEKPGSFAIKVIPNTKFQ
jgi:serine/threonine protein kinase